ncbi:MAG TPA: hypothetical protein VFH41_04320 [Bradyrhizobium sp.]|nr:hypothetical protein [Bradyrhizobium sp.]
MGVLLPKDTMIAFFGELATLFTLLAKERPVRPVGRPAFPVRAAEEPEPSLGVIAYRWPGCRCSRQAFAVVHWSPGRPPEPELMAQYSKYSSKMILKLRCRKTVTKQDQGFMNRNRKPRAIEANPARW